MPEQVQAIFDPFTYRYFAFVKDSICGGQKCLAAHTDVSLDSIGGKPSFYKTPSWETKLNL